MEHKKLALDNICGGAVSEVFERAVAELNKNIKDINTPADAKREINIKLSFKPYADRSGAEVSFACSTKLPSVSPVKGTIHISSAEGKLQAYPKDPRQDALFEAPAAGGKV